MACQESTFAYFPKLCELPWHNFRIPYAPYSFRVRIRIKIRVRVRVRIGLGIRVRD